MDKSEIYSRAESIIQKRRVDAVTENQRRMDEIDDKIPEIREMNVQLFNTSREIYRIIADGKNVEKRLEELKNSNLDVQNVIKTHLLSHGYPTDYLDMKYYCNDCNDTGYNNGEFCHCFHELIGKIATDEMNKTSQIKLSSFDTFSLDYYSGDDYAVMKKIFYKCRQFANEFGMTYENIFMTGDTGLGKTHLSLAIASEVIKKGYNVIYDSTINILHKIEVEHFGRDKVNDTLSLVNSTDLLILDDLGTEYTSPFYISNIYNIINTRLNMSKSTIISTNLNTDELKKRYSPRVHSRILTMYTGMEFKGKDVRYQKKDEIKKNRQI